MGKMPCHISDGPQLPEDVPGYVEEQDPDEAYDRHRQDCIDRGECYRCNERMIDGLCPICDADKLNLAIRKIHDAGSAETYRRAHKTTEPCPYCKGHGADPLSDNVNWLPCSECHGSGRIPKRRKP